MALLPARNRKLPVLKLSTCVKTWGVENPPHSPTNAIHYTTSFVGSRNIESCPRSSQQWRWWDAPLGATLFQRPMQVLLKVQGEHERALPSHSHGPWHQSGEEDCLLRQGQLQGANLWPQGVLMRNADPCRPHDSNHHKNAEGNGRRTRELRTVMGSPVCSISTHLTASSPSTVGGIPRTTCHRSWTCR